MKCKKECLKKNKSCKQNSCKHWIDYNEDLNCSFRIRIGKNNTIEEMRLASSMIINATKKLKEN